MQKLPMHSLIKPSRSLAASEEPVCNSRSFERVQGSRGRGTAAIKRLHSMLEQTEETMRDAEYQAAASNGLQLPPAARLSSFQAAAPLRGEAAPKRHRDNGGLMGIRPRGRNEANVSESKPRSYPKPATSRPATAPQPQHNSVKHHQAPAAPVKGERTSNASLQGSNGSQQSDEEMWDAQEVEHVPPEQPQTVHASKPPATAPGVRSPMPSANGKPSRRVASGHPTSPHATLKPSVSSRRSPVAPSTPPAPKSHSAGPTADDPIVLSSGDETEAPEEAPIHRPPLATRPSPQRPLPPPTHRPTIRPLSHFGSGAAASSSSVSHASSSKGLLHTGPASMQGSTGRQHGYAAMGTRDSSLGGEVPISVSKPPAAAPKAAVFRGGNGKLAAQHAVRARRGAATSKGRQRNRSGPSAQPASASFHVKLDGDSGREDSAHQPHLPPKPDRKPAATFGLRTNTPPAPVKQQSQEHQQQKGHAHPTQAQPRAAARDASTAAPVPAGHVASPDDGCFFGTSESQRRHEHAPSFGIKLAAADVATAAGRGAHPPVATSGNNQPRVKGHGPLPRPVPQPQPQRHGQGTAEDPVELSTDEDSDRAAHRSPGRNTTFVPSDFTSGDKGSRVRTSKASACQHITLS